MEDVIVDTAGKDGFGRYLVLRLNELKTKGLKFSGGSAGGVFVPVCFAGNTYDDIGSRLEAFRMRYLCLREEDITKFGRKVVSLYTIPYGAIKGAFIPHPSVMGEESL